MSRDNIVYLTCGLLLGLIIGSLVIGPRVARSSLAGAPVAGPVAGEQPAPSVTATSSMTSPVAGAVGGGNPMEMVRKQIESLKGRLAADPNDAAALAQLGNMYMDAGKYAQAVEYYERALRLHEDSNLRTDLGICYKETGQLDKSLSAFQRVAREKPRQWQALFNVAILLAEMKRFDEARTAAALLKKMRPDDAQVQKLNEALAAAK